MTMGGGHLGGDEHARAGTAMCTHTGNRVKVDPKSDPVWARAAACAIALPAGARVFRDGRALHEPVPPAALQADSLSTEPPWKSI